MEEKNKTFKDIVGNDDLNTFINISEFADEHTLNGKQMPMVLVNETMDKASIARINEQSDMQNAIYSKLVTVHVKTADLETIPCEGMLLTLDDKEYRVTSYLSDMGISTINLEAFDVC